MTPEQQKNREIIEAFMKAFTQKIAEENLVMNAVIQLLFVLSDAASDSMHRDAITIDRGQSAIDRGIELELIEIDDDSVVWLTPFGWTAIKLLRCHEEALRDTKQ